METKLNFIKQKIHHCSVSKKWTIIKLKWLDAFVKYDDDDYDHQTNVSFKIKILFKTMRVCYIYGKYFPQKTFDVIK